MTNGICTGGNEWPVGSGAVLYKRDTWHGDEPEMWHVEDVYRPETGGCAYVHIWDGTHTTDEWLHIEDFRAMYDPAGWSCSEKPTYILTRRHGHRAYPQDRMTPEVYQ